MLETLDSYLNNYAAYEYPVAASQLFLAMLGMGALLSQYLPEDFRMPLGLIARDIFATLIIPLVLGMLVKAWTNTYFAAQFSEWAIRLSLMMILAIAVKATVFPAQPGVLDPIGDAVLFVALLYAGVSMFMMLVGHQRRKFSQAR